MNNIIVNNGFVQASDKETLFGDEDVMIVEPMSLTDLVCQLGLFKSKSQARQSNRVGDIPSGYSEFKGNKKTPLYVWNPTE
ncbi:hypothetical protein VPHF86_0259 [Vibrio phage F86]